MLGPLAWQGKVPIGLEGGLMPSSLSVRLNAGVLPCLASLPQEARQRLLTPGGRLTDEERSRIRQLLSVLEPTGGGTTGNLSASSSFSE